MSEFVLPGADTDKYIWIVRKGNGQAHVYPSPAILKMGVAFQVINRTGEQADITFPASYVTPPTLCLPAGASGTATPITRDPAYVEYDVAFPGGGYAEGGSKPGVIVEH